MQELLQTKNPARDTGMVRLLSGMAAIIIGIAAGILVAFSSSPLVPIGIAVALVAVFATIKRIELGLLALIFMTWTRLSDIAIKYHNVPSITQWFFVFLLALILIRWLIQDERPQGWLRALVLIGGYGMVGMASLFFATDYALGQEWLVIFVKDGAIALIVALLITRAETLRHVIWALLAAGIFIGTLSVLQYLTGTFTNNYGGFAQAAVQNIVGQTSDYRIAGPVGDPNYYAEIMLVLVPLALDRALAESSRTLRFLAVWALVVCTLSVIFTFSRGGFLALAVIIVLRLVLRPPNMRTLFIIGALCVALWMLLPANYTSRLVSVADLVPAPDQNARSFEDSLRGRYSAVLVGLRMFQDHPVLGVGKMNYAVNYQYYSQALGIDSKSWQQAAHNLYLEVLSETGLVGIVFFGALLLFMFRDMRRARAMLIEAQMPQYAEMIFALTLGITGYLVASIFLHAAYPRYFWVLVGIALATPELAQHELARYREKNARAAALAENARAAQLNPVTEGSGAHE